MTFSVLIVEDEALVAMSLEMMIEDAGWSVAGTASTVKDALAVVEKATPDCALLDLNLRGESSKPVAEVLAAMGVPFAFTSGYDAAGVSAQFPGRLAFPKPVDENRVKRFLGETAKAAGKA